MNIISCVFDRGKYDERSQVVYDEIGRLLKDFEEIYIYFFFSPSIQVEHSVPGLYLAHFLEAMLSKNGKKVYLKVFGIITDKVKGDWGERKDALLSSLGEKGIFSKVRECLEAILDSKGNDRYHSVIVESIREREQSGRESFYYEFASVQRKIFVDVYYNRRLKSELEGIFRRKSNFKILFIVDLSGGLQAITASLLTLVSNVFMNLCKVKLGLVEALKRIELFAIDSNKKQESANDLRTIECLTKFSATNLKIMILSPTEILEAMGLGNYVLAKNLMETYELLGELEGLGDIKNTLKTLITFFEYVLSSVSMLVGGRKHEINMKQEVSLRVDPKTFMSLVRDIRVGKEDKTQLSKCFASVISNILGMLVKKFADFVEMYKKYLEDLREVSLSQGALYKFARENEEFLVLSYLMYLYYALLTDSFLRLIRKEVDIIAIDVYSLVEKSIIILSAFLDKIVGYDRSQIINKVPLKRVIENIIDDLMKLPDSIEDIDLRDLRKVLRIVMCLCWLAHVYMDVSELRHRSIKIHGNLPSEAHIATIFEIFDILGLVANNLLTMLLRDYSQNICEGIQSSNNIVFKDLLRFLPINKEAIDPYIRRLLDGHINAKPSSLLSVVESCNELWQKLHASVIEKLSKPKR